VRPGIVWRVQAPWMEQGLAISTVSCISGANRGQTMYRCTITPTFNTNQRNDYSRTERRTAVEDNWPIDRDTDDKVRKRRQRQICRPCHRAVPFFLSITIPCIFLMLFLASSSVLFSVLLSSSYLWLSLTHTALLVDRLWSLTVTLKRKEETKKETVVRQGKEPDYRSAKY